MQRLMIESLSEEIQANISTRSKMFYGPLRKHIGKINFKNKVDMLFELKVKCIILMFVLMCLFEVP